MRSIKSSEYTRRVKAGVVLPCILLLTCGLPTSATGSPLPPAPVMQSDDPYVDPWEDFISWYLELLWMLINDYPLPKLEDPAEKKLAQFNAGYAQVGIRDDLTQGEVEEFLIAAIDLMEFLEADRGPLTDELFNETMDTLAEIIEILWSYGGEPGM